MVAVENFLNCIIFFKYTKDEGQTVRSPKFKFTQKTLETLFYDSGIKAAWRETVKKQLKDQSIQDLIDFKDYDYKLDTVATALKDTIISGVYEPKPAKRFLIEKSKGLCRQMTVVQPIDLLVLEMLSRIVHADLKKAAPTKKAFFQPNDGNFKNNLRPLEQQYGSFASWKRFQKETFKFAKDCNYVVVSDVANFFDFIDFRHLRNIVSGNVHVRETFLDLLMTVLQRLSWSPDYMPNSQVGMPQMESSAPRVLANAMLYEVDNVATDIAGDNYARFMDDIDIGVESVSKAKKVIRDIDLALQSRQLRLNSGKTKILSAEDAYNHFCIDQNIYLSIVENKLKDSTSTAEHAHLIEQLDEKYYEWWGNRYVDTPSNDSIFLSGNGAKVLKWTWRLRKIHGLNNPQSHLWWAIENEPSLRSNAFLHLSFVENPENSLLKISRGLLAGNFVDDQTLIDLAKFLVYARLPNSGEAGKQVEKSIRKIVSYSVANESVGVFCGLQIFAKYGKAKDILDIAEKHRPQINSDYWTARAFAGCFPRFTSQVAHVEFKKIIDGIGNVAAKSVYHFHHNLLSDASFANRHKSYLRSPNSSLRSGVEFAKILMLLTVKENHHLTEENYQAFVSKHKSLPLDDWFKCLGFR